MALSDRPPTEKVKWSLDDAYRHLDRALFEEEDADRRQEILHVMAALEALMTDSFEFEFPRNF